MHFRVKNVLFLQPRRHDRLRGGRRAPRPLRAADCGGLRGRGRRRRAALSLQRRQEDAGGDCGQVSECFVGLTTGGCGPTPACVQLACPVMVRD